jgi:O-antigen/teichoic acid export membrane protein
VFGDKYAGVMFILSIWAFAIPIRFVATSVGSVLTTGVHMIRKVKYMAAVAFANVLLSLLLIELIGITGVAYAVLVSDGLLLLLYYYSVNKFVFEKVV